MAVRPCHPCFVREPSSTLSVAQCRLAQWAIVPQSIGLSCAVLAHNLTRWSARLGGIQPDDRLTVARTLRARLLVLPGRLVNRSGRLVLRLPEHAGLLSPIVHTIPLQLLAYHTAVIRGTDVDKPRNLAKSVTVE